MTERFYFGEVKLHSRRPTMLSSLFAVTAAEHQAAGLHGAWILGAVALVICVAVVWDWWKDGPR
jgi:aspartate oxidase